MTARESSKSGSHAELLTQTTVLLSYGMTALTMASGFLVIPNIAGYVTGNLHFPVDKLQWLYAIGGATSVFTIPFVGKLVDRFGSFRVGTFGVVTLALVQFAVFYNPNATFLGVSVTSALAQSTWWMALLFVAFMTSLAFRNVAYNTLTTKVPPSHQRARFNSLQSSVQHIASATGAYLSAQLLTSSPGGVVGTAMTASIEPLVGMDRVVMLSVGLAAGIPMMLWIVEGRVRSRLATQALTPGNVPATS